MKENLSGSSSSSPWVTIIVIVIVVAILCILLLFYKNRRRRCSAEATGTINRIEKVNRARSGTEYRLFLSFSTENAIVRGETRVPANKIDCEVGDSIAVMYDPQKPQHFYLKDYAIWSVF